MGEPVIREALPGDVPAILETLRAALGETAVLRRTPELWAWKHLNNPFGESIVLVADVDGRIAGVRALMRWRLVTIEGAKLECVRAVDTATHPKFLRRGIFRSLTMTALDEAKAQGIDLVFNTPNEKSAPGYLNMGWKLVGDIGVLVRPRFGATVKVEPGGLPSISDTAPSMSPMREVSPIATLRSPLGLRTPRGDDYLTWRFRDHPTASYGWLEVDRNSGVVARAGFRSGRTELIISDLLGSVDPGALRQLASHARARYLAGWFSPSTPERRTAIRALMMPIPGLRVLRLVARPLADLDVDVFDLGSWDLSTSDLELL